MPANTPNILKEKEIPLTGIQNKRVSVIGYGNQGRAHALNLRDSGIDVTIGARNTNNALRDEFNAVSIEEASTADLLIIALHSVAFVFSQMQRPVSPLPAASSAAAAAAHLQSNVVTMKTLL